MPRYDLPTIFKIYTTEYNNKDYTNEILKIYFLYMKYYF